MLAGLPLRSWLTIGALSVRGAIPMSIFVAALWGFEPTQPQSQQEVPTPKDVGHCTPGYISDTFCDGFKMDTFKVQ